MCVLGSFWPFDRSRRLSVVGSVVAALVPGTWKKVGQGKLRTVGGKGIFGSNKWPSRLLVAHRLAGTTCDTPDAKGYKGKSDLKSSQINHRASLSVGVEETSNWPNVSEGQREKHE